MKKSNQQPRSIPSLMDLTPVALQCPPFPGCPRIFRTDEGSYLIVGRHVNEFGQIPDVAKYVGPGETVIEIPVALLADIGDSQKNSKSE